MKSLPVLLGAAAVAALALPASAQPPRPPAPPAPTPHLSGHHFTGDHNEVIDGRDGRGRRVVVARDGAGGRLWTGWRRPPQVMTFHDARGRDVAVYADHPVTRDEVEAMMTGAEAQGERARAAGERARLEGERARCAALEGAHRAVEAARQSTRDQADLREVR